MCKNEQLNGVREAKSFSELIHDLQALSMVYKLDDKEFSSKAIDLNEIRKTQQSIISQQMRLEQNRHKVIGILPIELKMNNLALSLEMNDKIAAEKYLVNEKSKFKAEKNEDEEKKPDDQIAFISYYLVIDQDNFILVLIKILNSILQIGSSFFYAF